MNKNRHFLSTIIHFFARVVKAISIPVLGLIEGLISSLLWMIFFGMSLLNKLFDFIQARAVPFAKQLVSYVHKGLDSVVGLGVQFHAFMNRPREQASKLNTWCIAPLNIILKPVYVLTSWIYQLIIKINDVVSKDLSALSLWIREKVFAASHKYGLNEDASLNRKKFSDRYSAKALDERIQSSLKEKFENFESQWETFSGELAQVYEQAKTFFNTKPSRDSVDQLSAFMQERNNIVVASVLINLLALAFPLLMLQLYDRILSHRSVDTLVVFCVAVGTAVALEAVIRIFRSYTTAWISARFEHHGYVSLTSRFLNEPINEFERKGTGAILEEYKSISTLKYHYSGQTFQQLMDLPFSVLYVLIIFFISPLIGVALIIGYTAFVFITWKNGRDFPAIIKEQKEMDLRRGNLLTEILRNVHTMKSMTMESLMLRRYERLQESCAILMSRVTYALEMSAGVGSVFAPLMTVMVVALGSWLVITNHLSNGEMAACIKIGRASCRARVSCPGVDLPLKKKTHRLGAII